MPDRPRLENSEDEGGRRLSRHGAPAYGEAVPDRFSADEVFQRIIAAADEELTSSSRMLFFSGVAAGFAITITFLLYASMSAATDSKLLGALLYPLGFIYIIIGGYQLYTENTLPPVALVLERLASVPSLLRHWIVVVFGNFVGGAVGAAVLVWGGVFEPETAAVAVEIAEKGAFETAWMSLFFKAVFAGLIVAGVVWVEYAARDTISRLVVVYLAFLAIPMGDLFHVVVSFTEALYLIFQGHLAVWPGMTGFVLPVLLGNTVGGVVLVTVVNYFQTSERRLEDARLEGADRKLSVPEWLFGRFVGRSYVPILDTAEAAIAGDDSYRIVVPVTNPRTETDLLRFACELASERDRATVHAVHVVQAPDEMSLISGGHVERITEMSEEMMEELDDVADEYDVGFRASTVSTHRSLQEVFDLAKRTNPDLVVIGWGENHIWNAARTTKPIDELANQLPCDFLVAKDRGLDASHILLPTAGGSDSDLCAEIAHGLQGAADSEVSLLHVVEDESRREEGEEFLREWAREHELEDAKMTVDTSGEVEVAIADAARNCSLILIGATDKGMLSRLVGDSLHMQVIEEVDCSVVLAERPRRRTLKQRFFGRGRSEREPEELDTGKAEVSEEDDG